MIKSQSTVNEGEDIRTFKEQKMADEERQSGNLSWEVVAAYFRCGGNIWFILLVISINILAIATGAGTDYWVSYW